ncbi:MAG: carbohydrate ABC transporter permease [Chloroflexi bacterium]|nr:carbohydrate ABC transporter permease [Chloroflexota bacterium]MCL5275717.1 carbohydrate ABC transporter permease [Chloroflexota bacterium]
MKPLPNKAAGKLVNLGVFTLLVLSSLLMAYPLIFAMLGSLGTTEDFLRTPWLPIPFSPSLTAYEEVFNSRSSEMLNWLVNTLVRTAWYIVIPGTLAVLIGYAVAKLRFRGRDAVFLYILSSLVLPGIVINIATFVMMARFPLAGGNNLFGQGGTGFLNRWPALLLPGLVNAYFIFLFRQTFVTIPKDFEEAARVDGAGTLRCLITIYLPMLTPVLTVFVVFQFVAMWNDYVWPLLVSYSNPAIWVLSVGFQFMTGSGNLTGIPSTVSFSPFGLAATVVATIPLVALYLSLQNYFIEGVAGFAIKG